MPATWDGPWPPPACAPAIRWSSAPPTPAHAQDAAGITGAKAASSNAEAVGGAETVILAVPVEVVGVIRRRVGLGARRQNVVDVTNRVDPDDPGAVLDGTSTAETLQSRIPSARVVKAFNTAVASRHADPVGGGVCVDGYVAGDDAAAKAAVLHLVESIGFVPIDVGPRPATAATQPP